MRETAVEAAETLENEPLQVAMEDEPETLERHVGGEIPAVRAGDSQSEQSATASELAFDNPDPVSHDVRTLVAQLFTNRFGGDAQEGFQHYDHDQDNALSEGELTLLLVDAGVDGANDIARGVIGADELKVDSEAVVSKYNFDRAFA